MTQNAPKPQKVLSAETTSIENIKLPFEPISEEDVPKTPEITSDADGLTEQKSLKKFHHLPCTIHKTGAHPSMRHYFHVQQQNESHIRGRPISQQTYQDYKMLLLTRHKDESAMVDEEGRIVWESQLFDLNEEDGGLVNWGLDNSENKDLKKGIEWVGQIGDLLMKRV